MKKIIYLATFFFILIIFSFSSQLIYAWTEPNQSPPNGNLEAPINTSISTQTKSGGLYVNGGIATPIIWDLNNTGYYLDPNASSRLSYTLFDSLASNGPIYAPSFFYSSDRNLKKNILPLKNSLEKISQLQGVSFQWKNNTSPDNENIGLIAQDVEKVYPELVQTNKANGLKSVEYGNLIAPLIEALKEQQNQINTLKIEVNNLKK